MFEKATRMKLRFPYKGMCTVEDLWDLKVGELDSIYKELNAKVKLTQEESLLQVRTQEDDDLTLAINIIKHIVGVKVEEANNKKREAEKLLQKRKISEILASKKDAELSNKSIEELEQMLTNL